VILQGDTFDDLLKMLLKFSVAAENKPYCNPFDDPQIIEGQATVAHGNTDQAKNL